jgi:hypothetical protein
MDKTDQQRLEILRKISNNSRMGSGSRVKGPSGGPAAPAPQNSNQPKNSTEAKPGCNVCSRKKRT